MSHSPSRRGWANGVGITSECANAVGCEASLASCISGDIISMYHIPCSVLRFRAESALCPLCSLALALFLLRCCGRSGSWVGLRRGMSLSLCNGGCVRFDLISWWHSLRIRCLSLMLLVTWVMPLVCCSLQDEVKKFHF
jgi:hypothetical protein